MCGSWWAHRSGLNQSSPHSGLETSVTSLKLLQRWTECLLDTIVAGRIDENMDDTLANVEGAQGQLVRYLNGISSNRWLMIKIFFVLIVFLMIFLFFVA
ncbi:Syntaxin-32 [Camellia lanceoleosa]|uniref:Syntaxin-32 n=1 Tax=Camellia lanceoleosa TaxID=1840588 RepID=A0ACC0FLN2_9ERIC|nr:Syntaxin-32 [Camellia lanceoleosa]